MATLFCLACHQKNAARLQRAQNAAAWVVVWSSRRRSPNSSALLKQLYWLPTEWRIKFKIACITYNTVSTIQPAYPLFIAEHYVPSHSLRSSNSLLFVPRVRTCSGSHSFAVAAIIIWNSFPLSICSSVSTHSFWRQLNTYIYISRYSHLSSLLNILYACQPAPQIRQAFCWHCALYKFTYEGVGIVFDQYLTGSLKKQLTRSERLKDHQFITMLMIT